VEEQYESLLRVKLGERDYHRLMAIENPRLHRFVADAVTLCEPARVFVCTDAAEDMAFIRRQAIATGEEQPLAVQGHTVHFDGPRDQARDRKATKYLVPETDSLSPNLNQTERESGLAEVRGFLKGAMRERTMIVRFLCLGPTESVFSIPCIQCTDSFYVAHSEDLLYRPGYEQAKRPGSGDDFFHVLHSAGKLDERMASAEPEKRCIYIDYTADTIYSVNTQYAGNTVGLKKLALRLAIRKADREGWLAEHMFLMGVHGPEGRKTYFTGAFPSGCGKTSTATLPGETIVGDDLTYLRNIGGQLRAVNVESGIFGIIQNVNPKDEPVISGVLSNPGEVIFSNVLVKDGRPYWLGMGCELPEKGVNFTGCWYRGKRDDEGNEIPPAHKNARYTVKLEALVNADSELHNPEGVVVGGFIYGGRDPDAFVPVQQGFDWDHGLIAYGACLESETTFTIVGHTGKREINVMSIQDFLSIPLGKYIQNNLDFAKGLAARPLIFGVNYFLRDEDGEFVNAVHDKAVWIKWMELRVHDDVDAIRIPTGLIPRYEDLKELFASVVEEDYPREKYNRNFTLRVPENLAKVERAERYFRTQVPDAPGRLFDVLAGQRQRLLQARKDHGDYIPPAAFEQV